MFGVHIHIGGGQLKDVSGLLPAEGVKIVAMVHQNDSYRLALEGGAHICIKDYLFCHRNRCLFWFWKVRVFTSICTQCS